MQNAEHHPKSNSGPIFIISALNPDTSLCLPSILPLYSARKVTYFMFLVYCDVSATVIATTVRNVEPQSCQWHISHLTTQRDAIFRPPDSKYRSERRAEKYSSLSRREDGDEGWEDGERERFLFPRRRKIYGGKVRDSFSFS
ncbi:hypothetical protein TNIN_244941 [Trichonephila inaurata madagascariensis]|uniref:Uncharacterized protein n=1 Tax=Trichonephila inaurata madagascariensis TaxID=2747483 RepID=A0A8X6Y5Y3_9ARAC|nr:hypothetical protein TNIN_244941 [Trichonephila inaurata madagascariensis]